MKKEISETLVDYDALLLKLAEHFSNEYFEGQVIDDIGLLKNRVVVFDDYYVFSDTDIRTALMYEIPKDILLGYYEQEEMNLYSFFRMNETT